MTLLAGEIAALEELETRAIRGSVATLRGLGLLVRDLPIPIGGVVRVDPGPGRVGGERGRRGEVVGFDGDRTIVLLYDSSDGIAPGDRVVGEQASPLVGAGASMLGRVIDGLGRPLDGGPPLRDLRMRPLHPAPARPLERRRIAQPMPTGMRVVDAMLTLGRGQRVGVFAGPGVGKSTLLASIARNAASDVNVIALIGERGREVRDFIEDALGADGLARSVVVVATGDESPLLRVRATLVSCAIAEHFRDEGADVLLMMDSVTRLAQAQRQVGLAVGEQPATQGYTPSVFALLPRVLERAGAIDGSGSITGIYTVLVQGDDLTEPISDAARGILDGHVVLSRRLAGRGHYPAVDILESISRVADDVCDPNHVEARRFVRRLVAAYAESEELISIGAYARGSNPDVDAAIEAKADIDRFLRQGSREKSSFAETCKGLADLFVRCGRAHAALSRRGAG